MAIFNSYVGLPDSIDQLPYQPCDSSPALIVHRDACELAMKIGGITVMCYSCVPFVNQKPDIPFIDWVIRIEVLKKTGKWSQL